MSPRKLQTIQLALLAAAAVLGVIASRNLGRGLAPAAPPTRSPALAWALPDSRSERSEFSASRSPEVEPEISEEQRLLETASHLEFESDEDGWETVVAGLAAGKDFTVAQEVLAQIPDRQVRENLLNRLVMLGAKDRPEETAAWILKLPSGFDKTEAVIDLSRVWVETNPQGAAEFTTQLPPGGLRKSAVAVVVNSWARKDLASALEWLNQSTLTADLDYALFEIVRLPPVQAQPQIALAWAENIVDEAQRRLGIQSIVTSWGEKDRAAAGRYVQEATDLDGSLRAALMQVLDAQEAAAP